MQRRGCTSDEQRGRGRIGFALLLGASAGALGCNIAFGLDEPTLADAVTSGGGGGGAGATGQGGDGAGAEGGGGAAQQCAACPDDCFEGTCGGHTPVALAPGAQVSCVLLHSGSVWCFGANRFSGLGTPPDAAPDVCSTSIGGMEVPCSHGAMRVDLPGRAVGVATGNHAACAVLEGGDLYCWGRNDRGLLGHLPDGGDDDCEGIPCRQTPTKVDGVPAMASVTMSEMHACALTDAAGLWCWGLNPWGQLGDGTTKPVDIAQAIDPADVTAPQEVAGIAAVYGLSLSEGHTCATLSNLDTWCWGENAFGAAGSAPTETCALGPCVASPTLVPEFQTDNKVALATGRSATCLRDEAGVLQCSGWNGWSFLGSASDDDPHPLSPLPVKGGDNAIFVDGGDTHFCYLTLEGKVACWGATFLGQLGAPRTEGSGPACAGYGLTCEAVPQALPVAAKMLAVGNSVSLVLGLDDEVYAWGMSQAGQLGRAPDPQTDAVCAYYDTTADDVLCSATPTLVTGLPKPDP